MSCESSSTVVDIVVRLTSVNNPQHEARRGEAAGAAAGEGGARYQAARGVRLPLLCLIGVAQVADEPLDQR